MTDMRSRFRGGTMVFFLVLAAVALLRFDPEQTLFTDDAALSLSVARGILAGEFPLAGPPASLAGRHFGPWPFYLDAGALAVGLGEPRYAVLLLTLLKVAAIAGLFLTARNFFRFRSWVAPIFLGTVLASGMWWWMLRVPWHSTGLLIPATLAALSALAVFRDGRRHLPHLLFSTSLLASWHLAALPLAAILCGAGVIRAAFMGGPAGETVSRSSRAFCYALLLGTVLIWVPTALYELKFPGDGPIERLLTRSGNYRHPIGVAGAVEAVKLFLIRFTVGDIYPSTPQSAGEYLSDLSVRVSAGMWLCGSVVLLLLVIRGGQGSARWLVGVTIASYLVYGFWLARLPAKNLHLLDSTLPLLFLTLGALSAELDSRTVSRPIQFCAVVWLAFSAPRVVRTFVELGPQLISPVATLRHAAEVARCVSRDALGSSFTIDIIGPENRRENAVYFLAGREHFSRLSGGKKMKELPAFREPVVRAKVLYTLNCSANPQKRPRAGWIQERSVSLADCSTCATCRMFRSRRGPG